MRVLIADKLLPTTAAALRAEGCTVTEDPSLTGDALVHALADGAQVLVVRSTKVPAAAFRNPQLGLIVRAGAGINTIDVEAANAAGVYVANCPGRNSLAVAELTIGLLIALDRRIPDAVADLRAGAWKKGEYSNASGLAGRTLGVLGAGGIGMAVAARARALGMRVLVWNRGEHRRADVEAAGHRFVADPLELAAQCDAVSLHLALSEETRGIAGRAFFTALRREALFINTSRAGLVDEAALRDAVTDRGVRAALDVFDGEPGGKEGTVASATLELPGVIATPHIGASTMQAQEAVADEVSRIVTAYVQSGKVPNVTNLAARSPASHALIVRHMNRVGVLSHVFSALKGAHINVLETKNIVFEGGAACIARIAIDSAPADDVLAALRDGNPDVIDLNLVSIGGTP